MSRHIGVPTVAHAVCRCVPTHWCADFCTVYVGVSRHICVPVVQATCIEDFECREDTVKPLLKKAILKQPIDAIFRESAGQVTHICRHKLGDPYLYPWRARGPRISLMFPIYNWRARVQRINLMLLKTLIEVIITNNRDTVIHTETSLSIANHHAASCTINRRK